MQLVTKFQEFLLQSIGVQVYSSLRIDPRPCSIQYEIQALADSVETGLSLEKDSGKSQSA